MDSHGIEEVPKQGDVATGTTILACEYRDGVVLVADSRTSTGSYVANRVSDKIVKLTDNIYACRSGSAADTQAVCDYAKRFLSDYAIQKGRPARVSTAAHVLSSIVYNNKDNLSVGLIVAGVDDVDGPQVYSIPLGGTLVRQPLAVGGSGSVFIYAMGDADYTPDMDKDAAVAFGRRLVSHAMARDGSSGGVIRSVVLTGDGAERGFVPGSELPFSLEGMADGLAKAVEEVAEHRAAGPSSSSSSAGAAAAAAVASRG
ncbi:hypothetical protein FNF27_04935 [Cafeteria roenbergensis]|uniref:proteasome endopeptidase complex n=1 Tax=Cafeteria roenbergensis TaxID=33653 RepID=A0A5A8ECI7_CAFRO|nr:hypothetical protein FNF31_07977 [Cafeteria roenbergensis]KAA0148898.1 hypothetical protein FNF29_06372 [Cafeteria roenbergensis]KAA0157793.1 hypothetical protein FNF28_06502 [Cafeteria roenbergensis]KAA0173601.1 hypothetical protein FNF27_04935 [Cafeteria roenbergensis]|eukprot:KAA0148898.1 hypothetical protein FNF29_06372 [Cafeteria roenbergensis]